MKKVFTVAVSSTTTAFTGSQPGIDVRHFVVTDSVTLLKRLSPFFAAAPVPYCLATLTLDAASGSCIAPASAAASADDLKTALIPVEISQVDDQGAHPEKSQERNDHENDDLPTRVAAADRTTQPSHCDHLSRRAAAATALRSCSASRDIGRCRFACCTLR